MRRKKMDPQDLKPEIGNFAAAALVSAHISNYTTSSRSFNDPLLFAFTVL